MTRSAFTLSSFAVLLAGLATACGSTDAADDGGGPVAVSSSCNACAQNTCPSEQVACTDQSCSDCQNDVTQAECKTGEFAQLAGCACERCSVNCESECAAFNPKDAGGGGTTGSGGSSSVPVGTPSGACGGISWKTETCQQCMDTSCCTQEGACSANAGCGALLTCLSEGTAESTCDAQNPSGVDALNTLGTCLEGPCATACSTGSSGDDSTGDDTTGDDSSTAACGLAWDSASCQSCLDAACCTQESACAGNSACTGIFTCLEAGTAAATCGSQNQAGVTDYNALGTCAQSCSSQCGGGSGAGGSDSGSGGASSGPAPQCGISWGDATCQSCMDTSCCAPQQSCVASADCSGELQCLSAGTAQATCEMQFPNGTAGVNAVGSCFQTSCSAQCQAN